MAIAETLGVGYQQAFVLPDGEKIWTENIRLEEKKYGDRKQRFIID